MDKNFLAKGIHAVGQGITYLLQQRTETQVQQEKIAIFRSHNTAKVMRDMESSSPIVTLEKPTELPVPGPAPAPAVKVTDRDTMIYQLDHILRPLRQIELHLAEGCKINDIACDCCVKSSSDIINFSDETIPIAARSGESPEIFTELSTWAHKIEDITSPSKRVDEATMRLESGAASIKRKQVQAMLDKYKAGGN